MKPFKYFSWLLTIMVNLYLLFYLYPFIQKTANSHSDEGPFYSVILFIILGFTLLILGNYKTSLFQNKTQLIGYLFLIATLVFWGYYFTQLKCLSCANGG